MDNMVDHVGGEAEQESCHEVCAGVFFFSSPAAAMLSFAA
jgi:hypothetical protein